MTKLPTFHWGCICQGCEEWGELLEVSPLYGDEKHRGRVVWPVVKWQVSLCKMWVGTNMDKNRALSHLLLLSLQRRDCCKISPKNKQHTDCDLWHKHLNLHLTRTKYSGGKKSLSKDAQEYLLFHCSTESQIYLQLSHNYQQLEGWIIVSINPEKFENTAAFSIHQIWGGRAIALTYKYFRENWSFIFVLLQMPPERQFQRRNFQ